MVKTLGESLTMREEEIRDLAARGLSNAEIASSAHISEATVKTHLRSIFAKTGATSRAQLAARAVTQSELSERDGSTAVDGTSPQPRERLIALVVGMGLLLVMVIAAVSSHNYLPFPYSPIPSPDREELVSFAMPYGRSVDCEMRFRILTGQSTATSGDIDQARAELSTLDIQGLAQRVNDESPDQADVVRYALRLGEVVRAALEERGALPAELGLEAGAKCHV